MRRSSDSIKRLTRRIEAISSRYDHPIPLVGFIYTDEDPNTVHVYSADGKVISATAKKFKKTLRTAFDLKKKNRIYLVISQFNERSNNNGDCSQETLPV